MRKINILLVSITSFFTLTSLKGQYPYLPQNTQKYINGTIGEERGNRLRYHYGLDFAAPDETNVYAIETGPKRKKDNASFAVGTYGYIHVIATEAIASLPNGSIIQAGTLIGTVQIGAGHVHLQRATENIYQGDPLEDPHSWEDASFTWINPLLNLSPLVDNAAPRIQEIRLFREDGNQATNLSNELTVFGKYDVMVNTEDQRINTDGTGNGYANAPFSMHFKLVNTLDMDVTAYTGFDFSNVPPNSSAPSTFGINSAHNPANFEYLLTSNPFEMPYDRYLNLRQKQNSIFSISTDVPMSSRYKDGTEFKIKARVCDAAENCVFDSIPNNSLFYKIDNFLPFLSNINVTYANGINIANLNRVQKDDNLTTNDNGYVHNQGSFSEKPAPPFTSMTVSIATSEPMQNMTCRLVQDGPIIRNMIISPTNPLKWTYTYLTAPAIFNGGYEIIFTGTDQSGNTLIDVEEITNENSFKPKVTIPTRTATGSGSTAWNNYPSALGEDRIFIPISNTCSNIIADGRGTSRSTSPCDFPEEGLDWQVTYASCGAQISLPNNPYTSLQITWEDHPELVGFNPTAPTAGVFCYTISDPLSCCKIKGCVFVEAAEMINTPLNASIQPACGTGLGLVSITNLSGQTLLWSNGASTSTIEVSAGTYTLSATISGCTSQYTFTIPSTIATHTITDSFYILEGQPCDVRFGGGQVDISSPSLVSGSGSPITFYEIRNNQRYQQLPSNYPAIARDSLWLEAVTSNGCAVRRKIDIPYGGLPQVIGVDNPPACSATEDALLQLSISTNTGLAFATMWNATVTLDNQVIPSYDSGDILTTVGGPGLYRIHFADKLNPACSTSYEFTKLDARNNAPYNFTVGTTNQCGLTKGSFNVTTAGGTEPYYYYYYAVDPVAANPLINLGSVVTNLDPGTYRIVGEDGCNNTISKEVEIKGAIDINIKPYMIDCNSKGDATHVLAEASGDFPPFTFNWDDGASTPMTTLPQFYRRTVTVTDQRGCAAQLTSKSSYGVGFNDRVQVTTTPTCPFSNDGTATLTVQNYDNELVRIYFDSLELITPSTASVVTYSITNLSSTESYSVVVQIGNCDGYRQQIIVPQKKQTFNHKTIFVEQGTNAVMCRHDVLCDGQVLYADQIHAVQAEIDHSLIGCGDWVYTCGSNTIRRPMSSRWVWGHDAVLIANANNRILPLDGIIGCHRYKICDSGKILTGNTNFRICADDNGRVVGATDNCLIYDCNCIFSSPLLAICPAEPSDEFKTYQDAFKRNCVIKTTIGYEIIKNFNSYSNNPKFHMGNFQTVVNTMIADQRFVCTTISYCEYPDRMEFLKSNFDAQTCSPKNLCNCPGGTLYPTCQTIRLDPSGNNVILCHGAMIGLSGFVGPQCSNTITDAQDNKGGSLRNVLLCIADRDTVYLDYNNIAQAHVYIDNMLLLTKDVSLKGIGSDKPIIDLSSLASLIEIAEGTIVRFENLKLKLKENNYALINKSILFLKDVELQVPSNSSFGFLNEQQVVSEGVVKITQY